MRAALALLALVALAAAAHAHPPLTEYQPLVLSYHGYLTSDGRVSEDAPPPGSVSFPPSAPGAPAPPLRFALDAPVAFAPGGGFDVDITLRADKPVVARDAAGASFELLVEPGGEPFRVSLDEALLAPGDVRRFSAHLTAPAAVYAEGEALALVITPLAPALAEGALALVIGGEQPSRFDAREMRVPSLDDLRLQDRPLTQLLLANETFEPPADHTVFTYRVGHASIVPPADAPFSEKGTYVVLRGEETPEEAAAHARVEREARVEAAHELRVNGVTARVAPGIGVVVRVAQPPVVVECARQCPAGGFTHTTAQPVPTAPTERPSVLVPPPRDTSGIPVSKDEPPARETPLGVLAALGLIIAARAKR